MTYERSHCARLIIRRIGLSLTHKRRTKPNRRSIITVEALPAAAFGGLMRAANE